MNVEEQQRLAALIAAMKAQVDSQTKALADARAREAVAETKLKAMGDKLSRLADSGAPSKSEASGISLIIQKTVHNPDFVKGAMDGTVSVTIDASAIPPRRKNFPGIGLTTADVPTGTHDAGIVESLGLPGVRLRDIIPVVPVSDGTIEYVRARFSHLAARVTTAATVSATSLIVDNAEGFAKDQEIWFGEEGSVGAHKTTVTAVNYDTNTLTVTALLAAVPVGTVVTSERFVFTPEAKIKPRAKAKFTQKTESVKTLAHWIPVTRQALADSRQLQSYLEGELIEGLVLSEEQQILKGTGLDNRQFLGVFNDPDVLSYAWSSGPVTDTQVDAIRRAMQLIFMASRAQADAIVLSGWDDVNIATLKTAGGQYLFGGPTASAGVTRIWGVPVVVSADLEEGEALVGAFRVSTTIWDREQTTVRTGDQHASFFVENCVAILAERRVGFTISRPEGLVKLDLSTAPVAPPETPPAG